MYKIVLMRHGESTWNRENRFTGWIDVDLTEKGVEQARHAGRWLKEAGFTFDLTYTSVLKRAIRTLWVTLDEMDLMWLPTVHDWRLNERHYGALQGRTRPRRPHSTAMSKCLSGAVAMTFRLCHLSPPTRAPRSMIRATPT